MVLNLEQIKKLTVGAEHIRGLDLVPHERKYFADDLQPNGDGFEEYAGNLVEILK